MLKIVLKTQAAYIGLLGSKKRGQAILKFLRESGVDEQALTGSTCRGSGHRRANVPSDSFELLAEARG